MGKNKKPIGMPQNNNTSTLYDIHYRRLLVIASNVFKWSNLPSSLPQWELESRLFRFGYAVVFKHPKYGIVTSDGSVYGINIYNHASRFTYTQPILGSKNGTLGVSGVCIYNTDVDANIVDSVGNTSVMGDMLRWFARMLTDIDVSTTIATLRARQTNAVVANTDVAKRAIDDYYARSEQGDINVPFAPSAMFENVTDLVQHYATNPTTIADLIQLKSQIMRDFYATFGVQTVQHKNDRMITDEIDSDTDYLSANVDNMLKCRQRSASEINRKFGTNIFVEVNTYVT